jgi:hypothetical protein
MSHLPKRRWLRISLAGLLFIVLCWAGLLSGVRVGMQRIALNPDPLQLTIRQRSSQTIPGLKGLAAVHLDDITRGQVILTIEDKANAPIVGPISVRSDDVVSFQVNGQAFFMHVVELRNELIGDDFATVEVSMTDRWQKKK